MRAALLLLVACGSPTQPGAAAHAAAPRATAPRPPANAGCPATPPALRSPCATSGAMCAYTATPECGHLIECYAGKWRPRQDIPCREAHHDLCPARPSATPPETVTPQLGLTCIYPDATVCTYVYPHEEAPCSGVPWERPPSPPPEWRCAKAAGGPCAYGVPDAGDECEPEGAFCGTTCCGAGATCVGGRWQVRDHECPP